MDCYGGQRKVFVLFSFCADNESINKTMVGKLKDSHKAIAFIYTNIVFTNNTGIHAWKWLSNPAQSFTESRPARTKVEHAKLEKKTCSHVTQTSGKRTQQVTNERGNNSQGYTYFEKEPNLLSSRSWSRLLYWRCQNRMLHIVFIIGYYMQ